MFFHEHSKVFFRMHQSDFLVPNNYSLYCLSLSGRFQVMSILSSGEGVGNPSLFGSAIGATSSSSLFAARLFQPQAQALGSSSGETCKRKVLVDVRKWTTMRNVGGWSKFFLRKNNPMCNWVPKMDTPKVALEMVFHSHPWQNHLSRLPTR